MTVVPTDLSVGLVEVGGVGEGRRQGVVVGGRDWVARWGDQGLGVARMGREWRGAVVLDGGRGPPPRPQGLSLGKLVPQLRHTFFFLCAREDTRKEGHIPVRIVNALCFIH